jgi:hypothetical protein
MFLKLVPHVSSHGSSARNGFLAGIIRTVFRSTLVTLLVRSMRSMRGGFISRSRGPSLKVPRDRDRDRDITARVTVTVTGYLFYQRILKEYEQPIPTLCLTSMTLVASIASRSRMQQRKAAS